MRWGLGQGRVWGRGAHLAPQLLPRAGRHGKLTHPVAHRLHCSHPLSRSTKPPPSPSLHSNSKYCINARAPHREPPGSGRARARPVPGFRPKLPPERQTQARATRVGGRGASECWRVGEPRFQHFGRAQRNAPGIDTPLARSARTLEMRNCELRTPKLRMRELYPLGAPHRIVAPCSPGAASDEHGHVRVCSRVVHSRASPPCPTGRCCPRCLPPCRCRCVCFEHVVASPSLPSPTSDDPTARRLRRDSDRHRPQRPTRPHTSPPRPSISSRRRRCRRCYGLLLLRRFRRAPFPGPGLRHLG